MYVSDHIDYGGRDGEGDEDADDDAVVDMIRVTVLIPNSGTQLTGAQ